MPVSPIASEPVNDGLAALTTTAICPIPAEAVAGDTAVVFLATVNAATTITAPANWVALRPASDVIGSNLQSQLWAKLLTSADIGTSPTWTTSSAARIVGGIELFRGTTPSLLQVGAPATVTTAGTSHTSPTATTTVSNSLLFNFGVFRVSAQTPPDVTTAATEVVDSTSKSAFTTSPNLTAVLSHRSTPTDAPGSYASFVSTTSDIATSIIYTLVAPPQSTSEAGPIASFSADPQSGVAPLTVIFANTSSGSGNTYSWNFGDGSALSTTASPSHTFTSPGAYAVTLTATNSSGTSQFTIGINATNPALTTGGLVACVCKGGAWVPITLYVNDTGVISQPSATWVDSAPWNDTDPWESGL